MAEARARHAAGTRCTHVAEEDSTNKFSRGGSSDVADSLAQAGVSRSCSTVFGCAIVPTAGALRSVQDIEEGEEPMAMTRQEQLQFFAAQRAAQRGAGSGGGSSEEVDTASPGDMTMQDNLLFMAAQRAELKRQKSSGLKKAGLEEMSASPGGGSLKEASVFGSLRKTVFG